MNNLTTDLRARIVELEGEVAELSEALNGTMLNYEHLLSESKTECQKFKQQIEKLHRLANLVYCDMDCRNQNPNFDNEDHWPDCAITQRTQIMLAAASDSSNPKLCAHRWTQDTRPLFCMWCGILKPLP